MLEQKTRVLTPRGTGTVSWSFDHFVRVDLDTEFEYNKMFYKSWLFFEDEVKPIENKG
jgi:hypothetical protein